MFRPGVLALLGIALLGVGFLAGIFLGDRVTSKRVGRPDRPREGEPDPSTTVSSLGKLMPSGGLVPVFGPPGDRIKEILVKAGQHVAEKTPLVLLASHSDRSNEVSALEIQIEAAEQQQEAIKASREAKLAELAEQARASRVTKSTEAKTQGLKVALLEKQLAAAQDRQRRIKDLDPAKVQIGAQEQEQVDLAVAQAQSELEGARAARKAGAEKADLQLRAADFQRASVVAESDLALRRVPLESLVKSLELAKIRETRATLTAPVAGTVVQLVGNAGDPTGGGPILTLAAGGKMVVIAEVYATDVRKLRAAKSLDKIGVVVTGQALGEEVVLSGRIANENDIGLSVARNAVVGFSPRSDTDRRVIEVRVELDKTSSKAAARFVGLEVEVEFTIRE